jgi:hypothetical protein
MWMKTKKSSIKIENLILAKILKCWRREKGLVYLKSELIEFLSMKSENDSQSMLMRVR